MMNPELYNGTELTLCDHRTERLWVSVRARIEEGKLTVEGQDLGDVPKEWFGSDEFEYFYNFDESSTEKLFQLLSGGQEDPVTELRRRFSGMDGCRNLSTFCKENGIRYQYFSWVSDSED